MYTLLAKKKELWNYVNKLKNALQHSNDIFCACNYYDSYTEYRHKNMLYIYRHPNLCVFQVRKISVDYPNAEDVLNLDDARKELAFARACFWQLSEYFNHSAITAMQVFVHICMLLFTILREESCFTPYFPRSDTCKSAVARAFAE